MRGWGRRSRAVLTRRCLRPGTFGRCLFALLRGRALRSRRCLGRCLRPFSGSLGSLGRRAGSLRGSLRRARRGGFRGRSRSLGGLAARRAGLATGALGARFLTGTLPSRACATGRSLAAFLGGAGTSLILSTLPAFLAGASAALSVRSLAPLACAGRQLFIGVRAGLG
ncbi:hypothetical protein [Microvirga mediterraneensis]|uniref:Uncharacterized protein n=1 Tax=Microvirga mediterraneensis TaxID=2754695 RepID=A0A838BQF5_9HYPH|nr:hypothetical protein [Microvirga mediterraneensis]MBA1157245.1 hypothetical protein [Microvirga mediterraneensis]